MKNNIQELIKTIKQFETYKAKILNITKAKEIDISEELNKLLEINDFLSILVFKNKKLIDEYKKNKNETIN